MVGGQNLVSLVSFSIVSLLGLLRRVVTVTKPPGLKFREALKH
jgi:hypothetical protein